MHRSFQETWTFSLRADLRPICILLWRNAWFIALLTFFAVFAGWIYLQRSEKIFSSVTTIEVEDEQEKLVKPDARRADDRNREELLKTIEQSLLSPALVQRLTHRKELTDNPAFRLLAAKSKSPAGLAQIIAGRISAKIRRGTRLIDITVEDANPALAQKIASLLVDEFIRSTSESRVQVSQGAHEFLRKEADRLQKVLTKSEQSLQAYKEQHREVSLEEKQNIVVERLKELNLKVTAAKAEGLKLESERAQIQQLTGLPPEQLLVVPSVAAAPEVADLNRKISEKEAEIANLSLRYKQEHPKYIEAASALAELTTNRDHAILKATELVSSAFEAAKATEKKLEEALHGQESIALELSQIAIPYGALAREVASDRALYESLLARLKATDVAQGVSDYAIRIDTPAVLPHRPIKPNKPAVLLLAFCGGLACSVTGVLGRHALNNSLMTIDEAERILGLPSLGAIPKQSRKHRIDETPQLMINQPESALAESFRSFRTTLLMADKKAGSVLFASALPGEGKSFCAINYSVALAQQGFRTLLIDADLRLPNIGRTFLGNEDALGLADVLRGRCDFPDAVHLSDVENLWVLPAGTNLESPAELLGNADLPEFIQTAMAGFDRIVIDTAPVQAVSETVFFVPLVDVVCLVVRAGRTPSAVVIRALQKLRDSGARVAGLVLNGLPEDGQNYYHYQASGYGRYGKYVAKLGAHH